MKNTSGTPKNETSATPQQRKVQPGTSESVPPHPPLPRRTNPPPEISKEDDKALKKYPQSPEGAQRRDAPQDAEALHTNNVMKEIYGMEWKTMQNQPFVQSHFSPYATRSAEFHIEINGEVTLGYLSNIDNFEGEVIKYIPSFICT